MAEKHKSKYKKPENKKHTPRKDLKDYTMDDKDGAMNPNSTKEKQSKVLRKVDKPVIDDVENMVPKIADKDRLYKDLTSGDYDPKKAAKLFIANQELDSDELDDAVLEEKIKKLTPENRERLVREYIRRKISVIVQEQATLEEPEVAIPDAPEVPATPAPVAPTAETPAPAPAATEVPAAETPAPEAPAAETPAPETPTVGPSKTFENFIISKTKSPSIVIGSYLKAMENAINTLKAEHDIDTEPTSIKTNIVQWMIKHGYINK